MRDRPRYVPISTYRLQLHQGFPFAAAREVAGYLARLGIGAIYTSPYFTAAPGSTHGYDVSNHNEINPELGGHEAHGAFVARLRELNLGHMVDFVPNHMGIGVAGNLWWKDVLENGPSSPTARFFDIDWTPVKAELHAKLLVPILGDQYGKVLERGELRLVFKDGLLVLRYFDHELPINPRQAPRVYRRAIEPLTADLGADNLDLHEFLSILSSLENMPAYTEREPERVVERQREKEVARNRLTRLIASAPVVAGRIEAAVEEVNGEPGHPDSFDALHELLEAQAYRLSYWRTASHEINYRRFFDINTLVGLRVELPDVFEATHRLLASLIHDGRVGAVRIDHPDGLFDPAKYFDMLQRLAAPEDGTGGKPIYVVAEKILSPGERLPASWPVHGTTGYNFLNDLNGLYVNTAQGRRMRRVYAKLTGEADPFEDVLYASKRLIIQTALASELNVLTHMLDRIAESNRKSRDFTLESLRDTITEFVACFPVYRTYVDEHGWTPEDRAVVVRAVARARRRNPAMESSLFDFLLEVILPREPGDAAPNAGAERRGGYPASDPREARERLRFAMKLQQYTGPVQAKGMEDTAFYRYNLLLSLNEVGGEPDRFGRSVREFHETMIRRQTDWACEMSATATHDTKLGEDVRARINVLSEIPEEWSREVAKWMRINRAHRTMVDHEPAPDRNDEYRFYQALAGMWTGEAPDTVERLQGYMIKSVKEAKLHTSWLTPNEAYENAVTRFVEGVLTEPGASRFLPAFLPFQARIAAMGMLNALSQTAVKIGAPGVPDFYQGTDLWDFSLVDPDNRRPVDFERHAQVLERAEDILAMPIGERAAAAAALLDGWEDGSIKLLVTTAGLQMRRTDPELFLEGRYEPLPAEMTVRAEAVAFARVLGERAAVIVAPRLCAPLFGAGPALPLGGQAWKTSRVMLPPSLAARTFRHAVTGAEIRPTTAGSQAWIFVGQVFEHVPVGMLIAE